MYVCMYMCAREIGEQGKTAVIYPSSFFLDTHTHTHTHTRTHKTEYNVHCHLRTDGLAGTIIADLEYPPRVAFVLLSIILERFAVDIT